MDADIGCFTDDAVGTLPDKRTIYTYNSDTIDAGPSCGGLPLYGDAPPVVMLKALSTTGANPQFGAVLMQNPGFSPSPPGTTLPRLPGEFYNLSQNRWKDGTPITRFGLGYNQDTTLETTNWIYDGEDGGFSASYV